LRGHNRKEVRKLILTASGGPFLNLPLEKFASISLDDALQHPNWEMGRKITIDSASMANKGLEVIEARWLFDMDIDKIDVCVHPQSVVHSMVEYIDGSVIAQMGVPDMRGPISYALSYPERLQGAVEILDLCSIGTLEFMSPDTGKFPALELAYTAAGKGGSAPAVLNASNEVAVEAFIEGKIRFVDIISIVKEVLDSHRTKELTGLRMFLMRTAGDESGPQRLLKKGRYLDWYKYCISDNSVGGVDFCPRTGSLFRGKIFRRGCLEIFAWFRPKIDR